MKSNRKELAIFCFFIFSLIVLSVAYGLAAGSLKIFPYYDFKHAWETIDDVREFINPPFYNPIRGKKGPTVRNTGHAYPGLNLVVQIGPDRMWQCRIMDMDGAILHDWNVDWWRVWPDAKHIPEDELPKWRPGTEITGTAVTERGDLVFNYGSFGMVALNLGGEILWRLPYRAHHSLTRHDDGNYWVCGHYRHYAPDPRFPNYVPNFWEETIAEVSPNGKVLHEWSVPVLLSKNSYAGLLYLGTLNDISTAIEGGDQLHLNKVERFPDKFEEGFFQRGDVLVSLRNINTVFVFNKDTEKIKFVSTGRFVRQHDSEFLDGNRISVYDNNNIVSLKGEGPQSRIAILTAPDNRVKTYFQGNPKCRFFSAVRGQHQWLPNGNVLITEPDNGRAFEINQRNEMVWEYCNYVGDDLTGVVSEVIRLPSKYESVFRKRK